MDKILKTVEIGEDSMLWDLLWEPIGFNTWDQSVVEQLREMNQTFHHSVVFDPRKGSSLLVKDRILIMWSLLQMKPLMGARLKQVIALASGDNQKKVAASLVTATSAAEQHFDLGHNQQLWIKKLLRHDRKTDPWTLAAGHIKEVVTHMIVVTCRSLSTGHPKADGSLTKHSTKGSLECLQDYLNGTASEYHGRLRYKPHRMAMIKESDDMGFYPPHDHNGELNWRDPLSFFRRLKKRLSR